MAGHVKVLVGSQVLSVLRSPGIAHVRLSRANSGPPSRTLDQLPINGQDDSWRLDWTLAEDLSANWTNREKVLREVPDYVLEYAPLVRSVLRRELLAG